MLYQLLLIILLLLLQNQQQSKSLSVTTLTPHSFIITIIVIFYSYWIDCQFLLPLLLSVCIYVYIYMPISSCFLCSCNLIYCFVCIKQYCAVHFASYVSICLLPLYNSAETTHSRGSNSLATP